MSDTPELSNVARVLISRMESHPQDFELDGRFEHLRDSLAGLLGLPTVNVHYGAGRLAYLNDTDKAALADAWRALNYSKLEKEIMDTLFQSDAEREEMKKKFVYPQTVTAQAQRMAMQNAMLASTGTYQTTAIQPGQIHPLQNSASNTGGLLGSISGIFK